MTDAGDAPELPKRPQTAAPPKSPPPASTPPVDAAMLSEQARMLKEYEDKQSALVASREAEERARQNAEAQRQRDFEEAQRQQAERERLAQERLMQDQLASYNNQIAGRQQELEREILAMRGQYERDQLLLEQYDRVSSGYLFSIEFFPKITPPVPRG